MNIRNIEGVGIETSTKLQKVGIKTTTDLLDNCRDSVGRKVVAEKTGMSTNQILNWVNRADLMRVRGIGSEFSDLLEAAGVDTVKELRNRNPENLYKKLREINDEKTLVRRPPALADIRRWVASAKNMQGVITY